MIFVKKICRFAEGVADYSFMIVVSATDFGFFSFGVNCAELFMSEHALFYPCWLQNSAGKV